MTTDKDYVILKKQGCQYLGPSFDARTHPYAQGIPTPFCGRHDLVEGKLYCEEHYSLLFQKGTAQRKRHKDTRRANAIRQLISDFDSAVQELDAEGFELYTSPVDAELV